MATIPTPDRLVRKYPLKKKSQQPADRTIFPLEYKKSDNPFEDIEEEEEKGWESPNNFFYERKYLDL